jgi:hypothetical protein
VIEVNHSQGESIFICTAQGIKRDELAASVREQLAFPHERTFRE